MTPRVEADVARFGGRRARGSARRRDTAAGRSELLDVAVRESNSSIRSSSIFPRRSPSGSMRRRKRAMRGGAFRDHD